MNSNCREVWKIRLGEDRFLDLKEVVFAAGRIQGRDATNASVAAELDGVRPTLFVIVLVVAALHLLFSSNTVTGAVIMPILIALAQDLGLDVWTIAAPAAFTSTLAFILVTESPRTCCRTPPATSPSATWRRSAS